MKSGYSPFTGFYTCKRTAGYLLYNLEQGRFFEGLCCCWNVAKQSICKVDYSNTFQMWSSYSTQLFSHLVIYFKILAPCAQIHSWNMEYKPEILLWTNMIKTHWFSCFVLVGIFKVIALWYYAVFLTLLLYSQFGAEITHDKFLVQL